jgi:hypothetical protein
MAETKNLACPFLADASGAPSSCVTAGCTFWIQRTTLEECLIVSALSQYLIERRVSFERTDSAT